MLIAEGLSFVEAAVAAVAGPLTDDVELRAGLVTMIEAYAGDGG
jgi:nitric oxide reductase NorQ protein